MHGALVAVLLLCSTSRSSAQSAAQFLTWGDNAMAMGDNYGASRFYGEALQQEPGRLELQWKYAEACRLSNQYPQAAASYEKVQRKDNGRSHPEALRWLGEMQLCSGDYDAALKTWQKVKQHAKDSTSFNARRARNALTGCAMAKRMMADPEKVDIEHLNGPVNTFDSEFGGRTGPDSALYFSSLRGDLKDDGEVRDTGAYHVVVLSSRPSGANWADPQRMPPTTNNGQENANCAWSPDHQWFYFTRCDREGRCAINAARWNHGTPSDAVEITGLGNGHITTQPMVAPTPDGPTMYYSTDAVGGPGGMDIWSCGIDGATAAHAGPLGTEVNTPGNETCPFFDADQRKLYFSSDFLPGLGGYDNFMSAAGKNGFSPAVNFGHPLNGPANDLYPTFDMRTMSGWFTSNRAGSFAKKGETCCNDIYRYSYPRTEPMAAVDHKDTAVAREMALKRITSLREKLPVRLYFHNDEPDPRTWDTLTTLTYAQTYDAYKGLVPDYEEAWKGDPGAIDAFFRDEVDHGFSQLNDFTHLLEQAMNEGQRIELQVRGFASPLAKSDYNKNLSLRRIQSLINHLRAVDHGTLVPYLDGNAPNGGRLTVKRSPFGEDRSAAGVSDELKDLKGSVYSVGASRERRIEIEQVIEPSMPDTVAAASPIAPTPIDRDVERVPMSNVFDVLGGTIKQDIGMIEPRKQREAVFSIRNTGTRPLTILSARPDCSCTTPRLPDRAIPPGEVGEVTVRFNGHAPDGPLERGVTITTDGEPSTLRLIITGVVIAHK